MTVVPTAAYKRIQPGRLTYCRGIVGRGATRLAYYTSDPAI